MSDDENIVDMNKRPRFDVVRGEKTRKYCQHPNICLDIDNRVARCTHCDVVLDVFDFLVKQTEKGSRLWFDIVHGQREIKRLNAELQDIKRKTRNAKAALARAKSKFNDE